MVDEIFDRMYQEGRADLHRGIDRLFGSIAQQFDESLKLFHDFQWRAPWTAKVAASKDAGCA